VNKKPLFYSDLIAPNTLLCELYPGDKGVVSPNTANHFQLSELGMDDFSHYVAEIGYPYKWAQQMCGFSFLTDTQQVPPIRQSPKCDSKTKISERAARDGFESGPSY
jgi:Fms-interacting protein/Thoc5